MREDSYWTRLQRRSVSRRAMLRGAAIGGAGLAGAALIGCGDDDDDDDVAGTPAAGVAELVGEGTALEQEGAAEAGAAGEFDWIFEKAPKNVPIQGGTRVTTYSNDDHFSPQHLGGMSTAHGFYDTLYTQFLRGDQPILFSAIETVERPDEVTNIMTVRRGQIAPNSEGIEREVDAEDIFLAMRIQFEDLTVFSPGIYGRGVDWERTEQTDDRTIKVVLTAPRNDFFRSSNTPFAAKEMSLLHLSGEKTFQAWEKPIGSGPYGFVSATPGSRVETTRNPGYSRAPWPFIENRSLIRISDPAQVESQFRGGNTSFYSANSKIQFEDLVEDLASGSNPDAYGVRVLRDSGGPTVTMRMTGETIFTDPRAREATARSFDRERWIEIVGQGEGVIAGPWPQPFFGSWSLGPGDPDFDDFIRHDPQRTRELLDALRADGVDVDREFSLSIIGTDLATNDLAVFGKAQLEDAGWNVRVDPIPTAEISSSILRKASATFDWWISPSRTADPIQGLRSYHSDPRSVAETFSMFDTDLDALIDDWERTLDPDEIAEKARNIQRYLIKVWPSLFVLFNQFDRTLFQITFRNINAIEGEENLFSWIDESYKGG